MSAPDDFPPQAYLTRIEAAKRWLATPSLDRSPRQKYVRADLCATDEQVKALVKAARPFSAAVFNDNGDVTISTGHLRTQDWLKLRAALRDMEGGE